MKAQRIYFETARNGEADYINNWVKHLNQLIKDYAIAKTAEEFKLGLCFAKLLRGEITDHSIELEKRIRIEYADCE